MTEYLKVKEMAEDIIDEFALDNHLDTQIKLEELLQEFIEHNH